MALFLIIDEDVDSGNLTRRRLSRRGHDVTAFTRTEDALKWLRMNAPDLILVSAGKYGEKAGMCLKALENAGIRGANIVLGTEEGTLRDVKKVYRQKVREVVIKTSDFEKLENLAVLKR